MQSFIMNSHEVFIYIHQGCFAGTGAIVRLPQCQWSKPDGYGKISQCITTTKHSKAKTVCIFLGILYQKARGTHCIEVIASIHNHDFIIHPIIHDNKNPVPKCNGEWCQRNLKGKFILARQTYPIFRNMSLHFNIISGLPNAKHFGTCGTYEKYHHLYPP